MDALDIIQNDNWLDFIEKLPVAFAQVREDPLIDQWIVNHLTPSAQGIMISSGGCTSALLAAGRKFQHLTLVDMNTAQLALAKLKISLLTNYDPDDRLKLLGHSPIPTQDRKNMLLKELNLNNIHEETFGDFNIVATLGPDYVGRYELLFARLQQVISKMTHETPRLLNYDTPHEQVLFLEKNPTYLEKLRKAFTEVMSLPNLVRLFGEEATQNSVMPFWEHFFRQTQYALKTFPASSNPYLTQLLLGRFNKLPYPWLQLPKQSIDTQIHYKNMAMGNALKENDDTYDFIHLSNILDWLTKKQASELLETASTKLNKNGWLIIRQLNSNLKIPQLCTTLTWQKEISLKEHSKDRSFFYQQLHIARKI